MLVEDLAAHRIVRGFVTEHPRTACVDEHPALRQPPAASDRRVDRIARGRHHRQVGRLLESAPILVCGGALGLQPRLRLVALEGEDTACQVREGRQVAARLQLAAREYGREPQAFGTAAAGLGTQPARERLAHVLEGLTVSVDAGHSRLEQEAVVDQLGEEGGLIGRRLPDGAGHQTSLAIMSRPASEAWIRSLATISRAERASRS